MKLLYSKTRREFNFNPKQMDISVYENDRQKMYVEKKRAEYKKLKQNFGNLSTGEKIREYRVFLDLSQEELAEKIGVTASAISKYETNYSQLTYGTSSGILKKIAEIFEMPAIYLLDQSWWK